MLTYRFQDGEGQAGTQGAAQPQEGTQGAAQNRFRGFLQIQVQNEAGQNVPGVFVQIVRERDNSLMYDLTTDSSGKTRMVTLPTPEVTISYGPSNEIFYTNYFVTLNAPGFYTTVYRSVSVYEGSTINMIIKIIIAR